MKLCSLFWAGRGSEHYTEEFVILMHKIANIQQNSVPLMASFLHPLAQRERCNHCNFRVCGEKEEEGGLGLQYLETRRRQQLILSAAGLTGLNRWWQLFRELWKQAAFRNGWRILSKNVEVWKQMFWWSGLCSEGSVASWVGNGKVKRFSICSESNNRIPSLCIPVKRKSKCQGSLRTRHLLLAGMCDKVGQS